MEIAYTKPTHLHFQEVRKISLRNQIIPKRGLALLGLLPAPFLLSQGGEGKAYQLLIIRMDEQVAGKGIYRKINKQMKFQFLKRVLGQGQSIYEAAEEIGIHYSTAKTIIFFHKHQHKSYRSFRLEESGVTSAAQRAEFKVIHANQDSSPPENPPALQTIKIVSNSQFLRWQPRKQTKFGNVSLTYLRNSKIERIRKCNLKSKGQKRKAEKADNNGQDEDDEFNLQDSSLGSQYSDSSYSGPQ